VNLYRATDPIGFRVFSDLGGEVHDFPVLEVPVTTRGDPGPELMTHSGYQHTPEYLGLLRSWTNEDESEPAVPPAFDPGALPEP
jgi:hypothetical protein